MTAESVIETMKRLTREKADAPQPEPTLQQLLAREEKRLGVRLVPVKGEDNG
jgi:hypothetical protein